MAKTARKKEYKKQLLDRFYPFLNVLCILFAVANFVAIFLLEKNKAPKVERIFETVTTNHVIVITNTIVSTSSDVSAPSPVPSSPLVNDVEIPVSYRFFIIDGHRHIEYCGRYFSEGSPTSYGRINLIFPDRVALDNGRYLKNTAFSRDSFPVLSEVKQND